ncbi:conjugative transposon TraN protein [Chryseobacterium vietnamense]|jgi:conjugative transposon TraN protein|uniref:conjugative transposon protein TraN n=1 Tax=Chryseobacterium vietnamense TaxID=866785 RepID=UPI00285D7C62|nr:conjugative transposon protein TraN [Chryseobacterium vietnamense]MDR6487182.1 conjugative transposon TraN protein [Chryseobacterium vietnamense]
MNTIKYYYIFGMLFILITSRSFAQDSITSFLPLEQARLVPFKMEVTYNKTSHLLFPSPIRYVDLGSDLLIAGKTEPIGNVLRVKSAVRDFEEETNFSVITQDGKFYNFDVFYSSYPKVLNYDIVKLQRNHEKEYSTDVLFEELKGESSSLNELLMTTLYQQSKRTIKHIGSIHLGIQFFLKSLYVYKGKFYFIFQVRNKSNVSFDLDMISFKIVDKHNLKRTAVQDKILSPLRQYPQNVKTDYQSANEFLYLLHQFTLLDDQVLQIELKEKNGGRHQKIQVENSDLINAKIVDDLNLKLK